MKILLPKDVKNKWYHFVGAAIVFLNYIRHYLSGYKTPRTFSVAEIEKTVDYDLKVTERWNEYLCSYLNSQEPFKDKVILELGPGPDMGAGLILLSMGAKKYIALDVYNLAKTAPTQLYRELFKKLQKNISNINVDYLKSELEKFDRGMHGKINYVVDKDFNITKINEKVDMIISQAAFEHFEDVEATIKEISNIVATGGILFSLVDLKTHTRWIKDKDPLNIYRYGDFFWNIFKFKGSPNRMRIPEYLRLFELNGWHDITIEPRTVLDEKYTDKVVPSLDSQFRIFGTSEMRILSFVVMAKKK